MTISQLLRWLFNKINKKLKYIIIPNYLGTRKFTISSWDTLSFCGHDGFLLFKNQCQKRRNTIDWSDRNIFGKQVLCMFIVIFNVINLKIISGKISTVPRRSWANLQRELLKRTDTWSWNAAYDCIEFRCQSANFIYLSTKIC